MPPPGSLAAREALLASLRGTPYDRRERHCWWLARLLQGELFGRPLPFADQALVHDRQARAEAFAGHPERARWRQVPAPVDGAFVLMNLNGRDDLHCGVFLDGPCGGRVWHSDRPHGVVDDSIVELTQIRSWRLTFLVPV
jgi:hypothetical protein